MSRNAKIAAGGVAAGLILLIWLPWWASLLIVLGVPAAAYLALDPPSGAGSAASHAGRSAADRRCYGRVAAVASVAEQLLTTSPLAGLAIVWSAGGRVPSSTHAVSTSNADR